MYWSHGQQVSPGWLNSSDHPTSQVPGPGTSRRFPGSTRWLRLIQHHSAWFSMIHKNQFSWKVIEWIHASLLITDELGYLCGHVTIILIVSLIGWNMMNLDAWNLEILKRTLTTTVVQQSQCSMTRLTPWCPHNSLNCNGVHLLSWSVLKLHQRCRRSRR